MDAFEQVLARIRECGFLITRRSERQRGVVAKRAIAI
jgi:hypothetical protein